MKPVVNKVIDQNSILLVEDNKINQAVVRAILKQEGISIDVAENGQQALDMCAQRKMPYSIIIMDLQMPVMDGLEATRRIKSDPTYAKTRIVVLTASAQESDRQNSLQAGADAFLTKPVNRVELIKLVT
jgi:two-component system sensor histidine kinase/response regulator